MRKQGIMFGLSLMTILSGCARMDRFMENKIREASGIFEDDNYVSYKNIVASGNVDAEGFYVQNPERMTGSVHVTFAANSNLDIRYFEDADKRIAINTDSCYLNPGDYIYANVEMDGKISSVYDFLSFDIYEYSDTGEKTLLSDRNSGEADETKNVVQIPIDYAGTEISIVPTGRYVPKKISLMSYYIGEDSEKHKCLDGEWSINEREFTEDSVEIDPRFSYIVSYKYDNDQFFCVATEPENYYKNNDDGIVIFDQKATTDAPDEYSVILHKYISVSIVSDMDRTVIVNKSPIQNIKANEELTISMLKYGDKVTIETNEEWKNIEKLNEDLICLDTEPLNNGAYRYILTVPEEGGEFLFDPSEYQYEHGSLTFQCFGNVVNSVQKLAKGSKIFYEERTAEEGYWLGDGQHYIVVGEETETRQQLNDIKFIERVQVSVDLKQPAFGGRMSYYIDGKKISAKQTDLYSGTTVEMDFEPWEGWICNYKDGQQYFVTGDSNQSVTEGGLDVDSIFKEDNDHKPELTVVIEKSVGKEMMFDFSASGLSVGESSYQGAWYQSDYKLIDAQKIGTEKISLYQ